MFKKVVAMIMAIALVVAGIQFTPATVDAAVNSAGGSSSWKLVWNDEFNQTVGGTPDTSVWSYDTGHGDNGWGNFEVQNYTSSTENVYIADVSSDSGSSDGRALAIKAMRKGSEITSGRIKTIGKQYLKYGKIEAKIRVENSMQSGVWPAFWMLGNNMNSGVSWPWSGEIDIMEHRNAEQQIIGTLHWNTGTGTSAPYNHVYSGSETTGQFGYIDTMESWHKYGIEWYENQIKFFLDDVCYQTLDISSAEMEEFRENYFILLNLAIGSTSTPFTLNQTVSDSFTDATMYVDYVRVYQGTDSDFYIAQNQVQETSAEPTTVGDGMTTCSGEKTSLGGWGYYVLGGNSAKYSGGSSLSEDFVLKVLYNNKATWNVQAFTQNIAVTAGHTYNVSVNINSTAASDAILMKDEIGGTEMVNKALAAGDNTFTGTFTATSDTMQIMFNLAGINSGTTLTFSNVTVTDTAGSGGTEVTTTEPSGGTEVTTTAPSQSGGAAGYDWSAVDYLQASGDCMEYADTYKMAVAEGSASITNIQNPGFASEKGVYVTFSDADFGEVTVNGQTSAAYSAQGAGVIFHMSAFTQMYNTLVVKKSDGTTKATFYVYNKNGSSTETPTEPEAVDGTLTVVHEWEKFRHQEISWTAIDSAVGYAIYTDGILYKTVESSVLEDKVPAWAFATENRNRNDQPTSVGLHNTAVVAILEGDTAPDNLLDVNEKRIIDRNTFTLNVNYIYGNGTDLWNNTGVYSPWNFTVCEQGVEDEISAPANVAVSYEADGSANLTINSVGVHAQGDQAWTIKAAIYDGEVGTENFINLAFDIKGPAVLAGQEITIKCIAEEVQPDGEYAGNPYEEKNYMFELEEDENGEQYAVIHYSNSFESTNDTYDLLFGLGLLDPKTINDGNPIDLTLSDTTITKVYGITSLTPAPVVNTEEPENSGIFVSWQTDVPNLLASQYSYNVYIDGVLATLPEGESAYKNNLTYYGYAPGEHTVKVESIYNGAITSTKETIVTIEEVDKPDLVVTNIDIDRKTEWHIGETVPIHITVKNIGTAKAEGHGHLAIFPYVAGKQHGHLFVNAGTDKMHTLDVGEEYTATFNYTISAEDDKGGYLFDVTAVVDGDGNYKDVESNPNNNTFTETFKFFVPITEVTLTNEGDHVKMDWEDHDSTNKQYIVTYYVEGETEPRTTQTGANVSELELPKGVWLTEGSQVTVQSVHTDGVTHVFALGNAYSDLIISNVDVSKNTYAVGETVPIKVTMKNVGVTAATSTGNMTLKPIKNGVLCTAADGNIIEPEYRTMAEEGLEQKLAVDGEFTYTFNYTVSETDLTSGVISLGGYADADYGVVELIDNSTEDAGNNITEVSINIVDFVQQPMDWTPLYDSKNHDQIYEFEVANSSVKANIEYKVLDTSFTDINYEDLVTKYEGYNNFYMSIGFEDSHKVVQVNREEGKMSWSYTNTWFQQVRKEYLVDENGNATDNVQVVDNEYLNRLPSQGCDIYGYDDKFFENTSETPLGYNGNGFFFNVNSFAPGKYYIMSLVDYDENKTELNYITLAFRVTQELEGWSRIGANDGTDIDKLAAFYHDSEHQVNAKFYYDNSDLGLACITAYNGTHLTITTDTSKKLNDDVNQTKIEIAYGVYDEVSRKVTAPENWDEVCINPGIYGKEGTNNLQVDIASLMDELPIHSANGGATDRGYYFLKIYNDLENEPESFIPVPLMVQAEIPEIIPVQGLKVSNRGSMLTVSWTSTSAQIEDGFLYDVYLDDVLQEENVLAGSYNLPGSSTIGTVHQVVVKAKWCEQVSEASVTYEMKEPETEPEETIPAGTPSYPQDDQWVLIKGQNVLPISQEGSFGTVNAQIWYYTDEDISSVVGYNDYYIALNGSDKYFTGESGRIFVQNGENTFFASKTIYDNHYSGQMLMNAEQLFTTYGDWQNGDTLYYTVRVVGNNGNTYKDFYFKVIPTEESSDIAATGDWRNISGTCELPVKMVDSSELLGTVSFLDCPVATDTYTTGTNTYDIVGYNGYYMSIIGDSQYYTGPDTKISVSEAKDTVQYAEDAPNLTFTEKTIYDKVYAGQIIIKCADTFTVEYATTYYLLKVESGESVTYIPVEIQVDTGDVEVLGFQMNTNQNAGGVAENSPSFRVVSKASKVMTIDNKLYEVKKMGTIYAAADEVDDDTLRQNMTLDGAEANDYIQYFESTANGKLHGYTTTEPDSAYNTYFALTFKYNDYMFHTLEQNYAVRAYAVLDDGTVVYGHNVYKANMYEIAQNLYESQKMGTKAAHDFLYTNVLNVVDMYNHSSQISNAMFKALNITSYDDPGYSLVESMSYDIFDYARCLEGYTYQGRGEFRCSEVENELLTLLNIAQETQYDSVYQWIYHETSNYGKKDGTKYQGCYRLTEYGWDSSIDKEFYTE